MTSLRFLLLWLWVGTLISFGGRMGDLEVGLDLLRAGKLSAAMESFTRYKQACPDDSRGFFYAGLTLLRQDQLPAAIEELKIALNLEGDNPEYWLTYGEALAAAGSKTPESINFLEQESILNELSDAQLWRLADAYYQMEALSLAENVLVLLEKMVPTSIPLQFRLGQIRFLTGDWNGALAAFQAAVSAQPDHAAAHYVIGRIRFARGELQEARESFETAFRQRPNHPQFALYLARVHLALESPESATAILEQIHEQAEEFPAIFDALARAHRRQGNLDLARKYAEKFQVIDSRRQADRLREEQARSLLSEAEVLLEAKEDLPEAISLLREVLAVDPDNWLSHNYLAQISLESGLSLLALPHLEKLRSLRPADYATSYLWARYHYLREEWMAAREAAQEARRIQPGHAELRNLLGNVYLQLDEVEKAAEEYRSAAALQPGREEFQLNLKHALTRLEQRKP